MYLRTYREVESVKKWVSVSVHQPTGDVIRVTGVRTVRIWQTCCTTVSETGDRYGAAVSTYPQRLAKGAWCRMLEKEESVKRERNWQKKRGFESRVINVHCPLVQPQCREVVSSTTSAFKALNNDALEGMTCDPA